jgi:VWFA-related protein
MVGGLCAGLVAQQPAPSFRSSVDAVFVPVSVTDRNRPVTGLTAADFDLLDNGVAQVLTAAPVESLSVDVTLVLDTSGSVKGPALEQFKADVQDIAESMQTNDRVRLITFATSVTDVFGLQPGGARLPVERIEAGGATSFYNALAAALMAFPQAERPQLVFGFTDGLDNMSFLDARQVATLAGHSGASLYLALVAPGDRAVGRMTPYDGGPNRRVLQEAVARNGGALYEKPAGTPLPALFRQVLDDFRASYVLSYTPRGVTSKGWHEVVVRAKNSRYTVRARKGYDGG